MDCLDMIRNKVVIPKGVKCGVIDVSLETGRARFFRKVLPDPERVVLACVENRQVEWVSRADVLALTVFELVRMRSQRVFDFPPSTRTNGRG